MDREALLKAAAARLGSLGFDVFSSSEIGGCFDIACRKSGSLYLIKALSNIDSLDSASAQQLEAVSQVLGAACLVIGERSKSYVLEDDVAYERHGILACTVGTMESIAGGGQVLERKFNRMMSRLDGESLRKLRESRDLSISELARLSGISEDTIYRYEHSLTLATPRNIGLLESALGTGIGRLDVVPKHGAAPAKAAPPGMIFDFVGFSSVNTAGPADLVGSNAHGAKAQKGVSGGKMNLVLERDRDIRTLEKKCAQFERLSEAISASPFFIVRHAAKSRIGAIPALTHEEIAKIGSPEELLRALGEKRRR